MKKGYWTVLKIIVSVSLLFYLLNKYGSYTIYQNFLKAQSIWVILALTSMLSSNLLGTFQWNLVLKNLAIHLPFRRTAAYYFTGLFFNNFMLSFIGGDVIRIYDVTKSSGRNADAISTVLLDRLIGFIALSVIAFFGFFYTLSKLNSIAVLISIPGIFIILSLLLLFLFNKPFAKRFESIGLKITPKRLHGRLRDIYNSINYYGSHPALLGKLFIIALFIQSARVLVHFSLARSIGVEINIVYFFMFVPVIAILIALPISIGGIGVREWAASAFFGIASVSGEDAVAFEMLAYLVGIICSLPGGIAFIFRKH